MLNSQQLQTFTLDVNLHLPELRTCHGDHSTLLHSIPSPVSQQVSLSDPYIYPPRHPFCPCQDKLGGGEAGAVHHGVRLHRRHLRQPHNPRPGQHKQKQKNKVHIHFRENAMTYDINVCQILRVENIYRKTLVTKKSQFFFYLISFFVQHTIF